MQVDRRGPGRKISVIRQTVNTWISDVRARQKAGRNVIIIRLNRLGWTQEQIAEKVGLSRNRISEIVGNANFGEIDTLLSHGREMAYIAGHYNMDLALAWALRLEGNTDRKGSKSLAGDFAHGTSGISQNVMNASGMISLGGYLPSWWLTHCSILQTPVILCSIR